MARRKRATIFQVYRALGFQSFKAFWRIWSRLSWRQRDRLKLLVGATEA